jgi:hypothetical protein
MPHLAGHEDCAIRAKRDLTLPFLLPVAELSKRKFLLNSISQLALANRAVPAHMEAQV